MNATKQQTAISGYRKQHCTRCAKMEANKTKWNNGIEGAGECQLKQQRRELKEGKSMEGPKKPNWLPTCYQDSVVVWRRNINVDGRWLGLGTMMTRP